MTSVSKSRKETGPTARHTENHTRSARKNNQSSPSHPTDAAAELSFFSPTSTSLSIFVSQTNSELVSESIHLSITTTGDCPWVGNSLRMDYSQISSYWNHNKSFSITNLDEGRGEDRQQTGRK